MTERQRFGLGMMIWIVFAQVLDHDPFWAWATFQGLMMIAYLVFVFPSDKEVTK